MITNFDQYVETYDQLVPFRRVGQYELHRATIERRLQLGSVRAAIEDDQFLDLLRSTLEAWGIGRRASRLRSAHQIRSALGNHASELVSLESFQIEDAALHAEAVALRVDWLITELGVVDNRARIVAGTKTLHHLLPELVPPMDRAWTGAFFGWTVLDPQNHQTAIFTEAYLASTQIAKASRPSRMVGPGWRTSSSKIIDNAIIGYCKVHGIGG